MAAVVRFKALRGDWRDGTMKDGSRGFNCSAIGFCAGLLFAGGLSFAQEQPGAKVTIEVGTTSVPKQAERWFTEQIASFQRAHPNIAVTTVALTVPIRPIDTSLQALPRLAENVIGIQGTFDDETAYLVANDLIEPIEKFLPDPEFKREDFFENAWSSVTYDGKTWGVPWFMDSLWIYCDWSLFEAAGIKEPPRTWDQFWDCVQRLTKDRDGDGQIDQWGLRITPDIGLEWSLWMTRDLQDGVKYAKDGVVSFDQPATRKNLEFIQKLTTSPYVYKGSGYSFGLGDTAPVKSSMYLVSNFHQHLKEMVDALGRFAKNKRLRAIEIPTDGPTVIAPSLRLYLAVRKSTPEKEAASWEFIKWVNRADAPLPEYWNGYPCRADFWQRVDVQQWQTGLCQDAEAIFRSSGHSGTVDFSFSGRQLYTFIGILSPLVSGSATVDQTIQALNQAKPQVEVAPQKKPKSDELFK